MHHGEHPRWTSVYAQHDSEGNPIGAVFSWDEWWQADGTCETLTCGDCGDILDTAHADPHDPTCDEWEPPADYVEAATDAYLECALWSSSWSADEDSEPVNLDEDYSVEDVDPHTYGGLAVEVETFIASEWADLHDLDPAQVGHDFWLTRNGHGAGFWDRGLGERGDRLTKACRPYGEVYLYPGDDGRVYASGYERPEPVYGPPAPRPTCQTLHAPYLWCGDGCASPAPFAD